MKSCIYLFIFTVYSVFTSMKYSPQNGNSNVNVSGNFTRTFSTKI